jgi:CelD/BcsL family acetyltransferase involved in cellulose biosynthesis
MVIDVIGGGQLIKLSASERLKDMSSAEMAGDPFTARIFLGVNPFRDFQSACAGVEEFVPSPMQSHIWNMACADSFSDGSSVLVTVQRRGKTVALAPLFRPHGETRLVFLGQGLFEPTLLSYADNESCHALAKALLTLKDPIFLRDVDASSPMVEALQKACHEEKRICVTRPMPSHPWLQLDERWQRPEEHLNSGRRSDLRRARRNAEKIGPISFQNITPMASELEDVLTEVFRVESANWKGEAGSGLAYDAVIQGFYRRFSQLASAQGILRILLMKCGDQTAAVQLGVDYKNRFWLLKMGYDQNFSRCSPGELLIVESLRLATERGMQAYEFTGTPESWTQKWTKTVHASVSVRIYAEGMRGLIGVAAETTMIAARRAAKIIRSTKARLKPARKTNES